ncbi:MAG: amino acid synthesis family protein, partial [Thiotrichales bacterium]|nr:amino acid synthesis family protein [Thiotrichales bacterium]
MREPEIRKLIVLKETVVSEGGTNAARPICRVAGIGVFANPCSGRFVDVLSELFEVGFALGRTLMTRM